MQEIFKIAGNQLELWDPSLGQGCVVDPGTYRRASNEKNVSPPQTTTQSGRLSKKPVAFNPVDELAKEVHEASLALKDDAPQTRSGSKRSRDDDAPREEPDTAAEAPREPQFSPALLATTPSAEHALTLRRAASKRPR